MPGFRFRRWCVCSLHRCSCLSLTLLVCLGQCHYSNSVGRWRSRSLQRWSSLAPPSVSPVIPLSPLLLVCLTAVPVPVHVLVLWLGLQRRRSTGSITVAPHVGNNISETYPRRIGQGLNDASCMLNRMLSSLIGLPNPAWVSLGNVVSHMGTCTSCDCVTVAGDVAPWPTPLIELTLLVTDAPVGATLPSCEGACAARPSDEVGCNCGRVGGKPQCLCCSALICSAVGGRTPLIGPTPTPFGRLGCNCTSCDCVTVAGGDALGILRPISLPTAAALPGCVATGPTLLDAAVDKQALFLPCQQSCMLQSMLYK